MDPISAFVSMATPPAQKWLQARLWWVLMLPLAAVAWLVIGAFLMHTSLLSVTSTVCNWLGVSVPDLLTRIAIWLRDTQHQGVAVFLASTAGVVAALSGRGSGLAHGRGGQIGWVLLAVACLVLDPRDAVARALGATLVVLVVMWAIAWTTRVPTRSESSNSRDLLSPGGIVTRWFLGMFETVMLPIFPLFVVIGVFFEAFSHEVPRPSHESERENSVRHEIPQGLRTPIPSPNVLASDGSGAARFDSRAAERWRAQTSRYDDDA